MTAAGVTDAGTDLRLVPAALTAWLVTAVVIRWPLGPFIATASAALALAGIVFQLRRPDRKHRAIIGAVTAAAAVAAGFAVAATLRTEAVADHSLGRRAGQIVDVELVPTESPRTVGGDRLLLPATLRSVDRTPAGGRVTVFAPANRFDGIGVGQPVVFRARVARPTRRDLTVAALTAVGPPTTGRAPPAQRFAQRVRDRLAAAGRAVLPTDQAAILPALVLGDTSALSRVTTAEFKASGLTHLMAVSGANVTIVCGAVLLAFGLAGPRIAVLLAVPTLAGFVLVVQPTASVLRAAVMGSIGLAAVLTARRRQAMPALAAAILVLLVLAPQLAVDIGFMLSAAATAALVLVAPTWSQRLTARGWPKPLADALAVCTAAQLATAPLVAAGLGMFSLVAIAANLAATATIVPITVLGTVAAALTGWWPSAAELLIRFTGPLLWSLLRIAHYAANVPGALIAVPTGLVGFLLVTLPLVAAVVLWPRVWFRRCTGAAAVVLVAWTLTGWM